MRTLIKTEKSSLNCFQLDQEFIPALMEDIEKMNFVVKPPIKMWDKEMKQPRDVAFYSDDVEEYKYSGYSAKANKLTGTLKKLLNYVNDKFGAKFNGILINRYNDGNDYISSHSDKIGECDANAGVVSISLGATRSFVIKRKMVDASKKNEWKIPMDHGMVLHMAGNFQDEFTHGVPKEKVQSSKFGTRRINFTFRVHHIPPKKKIKIVKSIKK